MLIYVADKTNRTTRTIREVGAVFAADRIHVDHKTQGVSNINNNETQNPNSVLSVEINMVQIIYNHVRQKTKCAKRGHFAKVCQSTKVNYLGNTNEEQQEKTEIESTETDSDLIAYAEFTTNNGYENYQIDEFSAMAISESFEKKTE